MSVELDTKKVYLKVIKTLMEEHNLSGDDKIDRLIEFLDPSAYSIGDWVKFDGNSAVVVSIEGHWLTLSVSNGFGLQVVLDSSPLLRYVYKC